MRPRTPSIIWIPFVFSVGGISWGLLIAALALLAALLVTPAMQQLSTAEKQRNDMAATVALLDQRIELQKNFLTKVNEPMVLVRLAERQFNVTPPNQQILPLDPAAAHRDRSVDSMLHESLAPVDPAPVTPMPALLAPAANEKLRPALICVALGALACSFLLGVRFDRSARA